MTSVSNFVESGVTSPQNVFNLYNHVGKRIKLNVHNYMQVVV